MLVIVLQDYLHPLQRFIRTQKETCHIAFDMLKPLIAAKQVAVRGHSLMDSGWYSDDRQHARSPLGSHLRSLVLSSLLSLSQAITIQVVLEMAWTNLGAHGYTPRLGHCG